MTANLINFIMADEVKHFTLRYVTSEPSGPVPGITHGRPIPSQINT